MSEGAVAVLVREYAQRRGMSAAVLAKRIGWSPPTVAWLFRGHRHGVPYLGVSFRGRHRHGETLLGAVARELGVPHSELLRALARDLGIVSRRGRPPGKRTRLNRR